MSVKLNRLMEGLLMEMTYGEALAVFRNFGVNPEKLSSEELTKEYKTLAKQQHPDLGGDTFTMQSINAAYDVLNKNKPQQQQTYKKATDPSRNDYTDINFIKQAMAKMAGGQGEYWTIWGHDGAFFRHSVTVLGNTSMFNEMAKAMVTWQTKGGNPYNCRAVFVTNKRNKGEAILIYLDGKYIGNEPVMFDFDSFNENPSNDQTFVRNLPKDLDELSLEL